MLPLDPQMVGDPIEMQTFGVLDQGIGDIRSNEAGSGARYNNGKVALDLIPAKLMASYFSHIDDAVQVPRWRTTLTLLGEFQMRLNPRELDYATLVQALWSLGPAREVWSECAQVFDYGRKKYAAWNWAKGMPWTVPIGCALRHIVLGPLVGEEIDPESGKPHRGHVACNIVMLLYYIDYYPEGDDRPLLPTIPKT